MAANDKLTAKLAALSTEALVELSMRFTLGANNDQIVLCIFAERELERRLSAEEFAEHLSAVDAMMGLAA